MAEQTKSPLLSVRDLTVEFGNDDDPVKAVKSLDLDVYKGETVAIVGESGSGKSVTALSMMRLIEFGNGSISSGSIKLRRRNGAFERHCQLDDESVRTLRGDKFR